MGRPFPRDLLARPTLDAARSLLGAWLVRDPDPRRDAPGVSGRRVGRIVEVEAYIGEGDRASHARFGRTRRNAVMFGPPGHAYVYLVYGMHHCLNVVTEPADRPAALLVRAIEPILGIDEMRAARARARSRPARAAQAAPTSPAPVAGLSGSRHPVAAHRLAAGPGLVAAAFDVDRSYNGLDLCAADAPLRLELAPDDDASTDMLTTPRIGIGYAGEPWVSVPWRFVMAGSPSISGPAPR
jgi:DNA-3-methyladenine glycosylase